MRKLLLVLSLMVVAFSASAEKITIYAAASTTNAVNEIIQLYTKDKDLEITPSFASSGTLAKQISNSAPADIFISANQKWMNWLVENSQVETDTVKPILANRLALIAPSGSALSPMELTNAKAVELIGNAKRVAIGDPAHVPAGKYAQKTLESLGIWDKIQSKAARLQNVRIALAMVEKNAVPLGMVYSSDAAQSAKVKVIGLFDENLHGAIRYPYAIVKDKKTKAVIDFYNYLKTDEASDIFRKYGFMTAE